MSLYLPTSFGKRKEAWVWLADLTAHNAELREHFSWINLFHKYIIFLLTKYPQAHCSFGTCFSLNFLAHFHELFASSLFAVFNAWNPSGWSGAVGHVHHMLLFLLVPGRDSPSWSSVQRPLMSMRISLWLQCTWVQPFVRELKEATGLSVPQAGLRFI